VSARDGSFEAAEELARAAVESMQSTDALVDLADALTDLAEVQELAGRSGHAVEARAAADALYARKGVSRRAASRRSPTG
jgi:hypothetical protein